MSATGKQDDRQSARAAAQTVRDPGLAALVTLTGVRDIATNPDHLAHQDGKPGEPFGEVDLLRAAKGLGLKARAVDRTLDRLDRAPLPALARTRDGGWMILAQKAPDQDKVLIHDPAAGKPQVLTRAQWEDRWDGRLLLVTSRAGLAGAGRALFRKAKAQQ